MYGVQIPYDLKRLCVQKSDEGLSFKEVYNKVFLPEHPGMSFETFRHKLTKWKKHQMADEDTQFAATYPGMTAHAATVHVTANGRIAQAWIREKADAVNWDDIIEQLQKAVTPVEVARPTDEPEEAMLEIPLFDLHFGVAKLADYREILSRICEIIQRRRWDEIHLIVGQDCLHNNDFRGHTAKGTPIEAVDIPKAWSDAWTFWSTTLLAALHQSAKVVCHYSRGNHDECLSWAFFKALEAAYPDAQYDDSLAARKCFWWRRCFVGFGHLEYTTDLNKIFRDFVMDFPTDFAEAECREIHTGHLHRESLDTGCMVRRLASAVPADEWSKANGYTGTNKRFQLFEFSPGQLRSVMYV